MISSIQSSQDVYEVLLELYQKIAIDSPNPSDIAGNNFDLLQKIENELKESPPNWSAIKQNLTSISALIDQMVTCLKNSQWHTPNAERLLQTLENTKKLITEMKNELNTPEFLKSLTDLRGDLSDIFRDILQG